MASPVIPIRVSQDALKRFFQKHGRAINKVADKIDYHRLSCHDCCASTSALGEYYMVHDTIWIKATGIDRWTLKLKDWVAHIGYYLCIGCLEMRLKRKLTPTDFTDAPVNALRQNHPHSERLLDRLGAPRPWYEREHF